ncbi:hypothetical protein DL98DRAFT_585158 [Cadophora sp. DSE1049]|nr:hypothetical protein DL98DRAFT_585158 [Cadophora sp. DSE1049]
MTDQRDRPDPEDILYLYQNCDHEWIGRFRDRPAPWQIMPGNSEDTRYILEPLLCPACTIGAAAVRDKPWIHWGCKHPYIPGIYPGLTPPPSPTPTFTDPSPNHTPTQTAFPSSLRVQDLSPSRSQPNVQVPHPRFCLNCLTYRQNRLRELTEVCERGSYSQSEELAYARGYRDGRVLAERMDFRWGRSGILEALLRDKDPYEGVGDAISTNLQDPLMNALANSLMQVDLNGQFTAVDDLANTLSRTNIDDPQFPVLRQIHWRVSVMIIRTVSATLLIHPEQSPARWAQTYFARTALLAVSVKVLGNPVRVGGMKKNVTVTLTLKLL